MDRPTYYRIDENYDFLPMIKENIAFLSNVKKIMNNKIEQYGRISFGEIYESLCGLCPDQLYYDYFLKKDGIYYNDLLIEKYEKEEDDESKQERIAVLQ